MKTTIDIADALLREARRAAERDGTTLRALVEEGLRHALRDRSAAQAYTLPDCSFRGKGLHPDAEGAGWDRIRELAYEGRGG
ncbi:MAG: type II toxin-antitoxin system VapB family antitoxin [Anaeromyxobacteraceae bacterium]